MKTKDKYYRELKSLRELLREHPDTKVASFINQRRIHYRVYEILIHADIIKVIDLGYMWMAGEVTERMVTYIINMSNSVAKGRVLLDNIEPWTDNKGRLEESYIKIAGRKIRIYHLYN